MLSGAHLSVINSRRPSSLLYDLARYTFGVKVVVSQAIDAVWAWPVIHTLGFFRHVCDTVVALQVYRRGEGGAASH